MKLIFLALITCVVSHCNDLKEDVIRPFIEGTYVSSYANPQTKGKDTLRIVALSKKGNSYRVTRCISRGRKRNEKQFPKARKQEQWVCIYKPDDKILYETEVGKIISFIPERDGLFVGNVEYQKVKEDIITTFHLLK